MDSTGAPISEEQALADIRRQLAGWGSLELTGHERPPAPVPLLLADRAPIPRMATMICGGCGGSFAADPTHVMVLVGWPCCLSCWDKRNYLRARTGLPVQGRAICYPEDFQPGR